MLIHGSCHCANISFALHWEPEPTRIQARACDCSFCTRHGAVWTSNPEGKLVVAIRDLLQACTYSFATRTADFHLCRGCGVVTMATSTIDDQLYAVVNVNAFTDFDPIKIERSPASFEGEDTGSRLERRKRRWIGEVSFDSA